MQGLEQWLQAQDLHIREKRAVTGGCCHQAYLLTLNDWQRLFIKLDPHAEAQQFQAEAAGLEILAVSSELQVPEVCFIDRTCLAMTYLPRAVVITKPTERLERVWRDSIDRDGRQKVLRVVLVFLWIPIVV